MTWPLDLVSRPRFEVATWVVLFGWKRRRDMNSRSQPGLALKVARPGFLVVAVASAAARSSAHDQPAVLAVMRTTWALHTQCARDLDSGCAHCAHNLV